MVEKIFKERFKYYLENFKIIDKGGIIMKKISSILLILVLFSSMVFGYADNDDNSSEKVCSADVKKCSDGSYVARDPENDCQFKKCPNNKLEDDLEDDNETEERDDDVEDIDENETDDLEDDNETEEQDSDLGDDNGEEKVKIKELRKERAENIKELKEMIKQRREELKEEIKELKDEKKEKVYQNQNGMKIAVHSLLAMENLTGGIGKEVSAIARDFNNSVQSTLNSEERIERRNSLKRFFVGGDEKAAEEIEQEVNKNQERINKLKDLKENCECDEEVKAVLQEQIENMEQEQTRLTKLSQKERKTKGIFGWIFK